MALDFSLLGQGPTFENALRAYSAGREDRRQTNIRNALTANKDNPEAAAPDLIANGELEQGIALQDRGRALRKEEDRKRTLVQYATDPAGAAKAAAQTGDVELMGQIQRMDEAQRQVAEQNAADIATVGYALKQQPPEARKAVIQSPQMQQWLLSKGFTQEQIASFDPTDQALDAIIAQGTTLKDMLSQKRLEQQDEFERERFEETKRHNKATEGVAAQNADSRRISATRPRASGGASLPPPPQGWKPVSPR